MNTQEAYQRLEEFAERYGLASNLKERAEVNITARDFISLNHLPPLFKAYYDNAKSYALLKHRNTA